MRWFRKSEPKPAAEPDWREVATLALYHLERQRKWKAAPVVIVEAAVLAADEQQTLAAKIDAIERVINSFTDYEATLMPGALAYA